ncbi:MAG: hypothetical protein IJZ24_04025, partial [Clostridia bacterium]|nr:hypothetical protein [Clostridia bacterium]
RRGIAERGAAPRPAKQANAARSMPQQKTHFCLPTKVRFLNDVCQSSQSELYGKMMTATPNDVRFANDVCLRHIGANITSLRNEVEQHHFERSEKHHIAAGNASFDI